MNGDTDIEERRNAAAAIEQLKYLIEDVLGWDYVHLTHDCVDGREFYLALKRLEDHYETLKKEA